MRITLLACAWLLLGCEPDRGSVREWTAQDHGGAQSRAEQEGRPAGKEDTEAALTETVWQKSCSACHGRTGRGDGPQGPMTGARDLTDAAFLADAKDEELARVIREGKARMPAFPNLPPAIVDGLVARIRAGGALKKKD